MAHYLGAFVRQACGICGSANEGVPTKDGDLLCRHCGHVMESRLIDLMPESCRHADDAQQGAPDPSRVGAPNAPLGTHSRNSYPGATKPSKAILREYVDAIKGFGHWLRIDDIHAAAVEIVEVYMAHHPHNPKTEATVAAVALYLASRSRDHGAYADWEVIEATGVDEASFKSVNKDIADAMVCNIGMKKSFLRLPTVFDFTNRFVAMLGNFFEIDDQTLKLVWRHANMFAGIFYHQAPLKEFQKAPADIVTSGLVYVACIVAKVFVDKEQYIATMHIKGAVLNGFVVAFTDWLKRQNVPDVQELEGPADVEPSSPTDVGSNEIVVFSSDWYHDAPSNVYDYHDGNALPPPSPVR